MDNYSFCEYPKFSSCDKQFDIYARHKFIKFLVMKFLALHVTGLYLDFKHDSSVFSIWAAWSEKNVRVALFWSITR